MSAPIFISHSSKDQKVAQTICTALESRGLRCWISSRDVGPGENFQEAIVRAIRATKVMVLVFTENANNSAEIKKELALASRFSREVIPVRAEDVMPNDALAYEFSTRQWIDLFANWEHEIERLSSWIANFLVRSGAGEMKSGDGRASEGRAEVSPGSESGLTGAGTAGEPPLPGFAQPSMPTEDKNSIHRSRGHRHRGRPHRCRYRARLRGRPILSQRDLQSRRHLDQGGDVCACLRLGGRRPSRPSAMAQDCSGADWDWLNPRLWMDTPLAVRRALGWRRQSESISILPAFAFVPDRIPGELSLPVLAAEPSNGRHWLIAP